MTEPIIELLRTEWTAIAELGGSLTDEEWHRPTALPGWSAKDNVSHIIGVERMICGEAAPDVDVSHLAQASDPFTASMETWIEARRATPPAEVLAEFREVADRRLADLDALGPEDWDRVGWSPVGEVPYRAFMEVRVFDSWMHEQDIRRATDHPGHLEGPECDVALGRFEKALGFVVGKKAGAADGQSVRFVVEGPTTRTYTVVVDGRARLVAAADAPEPVTATITLPLGSFVALGGGRWTRTEAIAAGGLTIAGDEGLADAVLDNMAFTP